MLEINRKLAEESFSHIGMSMIYNLVSWLQEHIPNIAEPFFASQKEFNKDSLNTKATTTNKADESVYMLSAIDRTLQKLEEERIKVLLHPCEMLFLPTNT